MFSSQKSTEPLDTAPLQPNIKNPVIRMRHSDKISREPRRKVPKHRVSQRAARGVVKMLEKLEDKFVDERATLEKAIPLSAFRVPLCDAVFGRDVQEDGFCGFRRFLRRLPVLLRLFGNGYLRTFTFFKVDFPKAM